MCTHVYVFIDHRHVNVFIHLLYFYGWSQPRNCFNNKIFRCTVAGPLLPPVFAYWEQP